MSFSSLCLGTLPICQMFTVQNGNENNLTLQHNSTSQCNTQKLHSFIPLTKFDQHEITHIQTKYDITYLTLSRHVFIVLQGHK